MTEKQIIEAAREQFKDIRISDIHECEFHLSQIDKLIHKAYKDGQEERMQTINLCSDENCLCCNQVQEDINKLS